MGWLGVWLAVWLAAGESGELRLEDSVVRSGEGLIRVGAAAGVSEAGVGAISEMGVMGRSGVVWKECQPRAAMTTMVAEAEAIQRRLRLGSAWRESLTRSSVVEVAVRGARMGWAGGSLAATAAGE